jgi:hypothetical protein
MLSRSKSTIVYLVFILLAACSGSKDSDRIIRLKTLGTQVQQGSVNAWFPKDSLAMDRMRQIVDTLNLGIRLARELIGASQPWQQFSDSVIHYYFFPDNFISHTTNKAEILIPFWRIKTAKAPWLHETMHILFRSTKGNWNEVSTINAYFSRPLWLAEGLADYSAFRLADSHQIPIFDIQNIGGNSGMDSVCAERIKAEKGTKVLEYIGDTGMMRELSGNNRREYAPIFYGCSCSFTKYLAETYGWQNLITANYEFDNEHSTIEKHTGKSMTELKQEWIGTLRNLPN